MRDVAAGSFRDPAGSCCVMSGRVLRLLNKEGETLCDKFLGTSSASVFQKRGQLVSTRRLSATEQAALLGDSNEVLRGFPEQSFAAVLEHERIPFASYPAEWAPEMLWEAGRLTLDLAREALADGYCLKDATPYNVLFRGTAPIFVDLLSFESRIPGDAVWLAYAQFVRTFLLPLLANRRWGIPLSDIFTTRREGLEPQEVFGFCSVVERFTPPMLSLVSIPTWLRPKARAKGQSLYQSRKMAPDKALFILESLFKRLSRTLESLRPSSSGGSTWSEYMGTHSYEQAAFGAKEQFVKDCLEEWKPARVLDLGANTGHFSAMAAGGGARVVAVDLDPDCVNAVWRRARAERLNILPLVVNLGRPTPAVGWRNQECASFLDRAAGQFDCVFMLALVHHLLVTERVPLEEILKLAADLTTSWAVIECVLPEDTMFGQLTRGRDQLHAGMNQETFERACRERFQIVRCQKIPGTCRVMYALEIKRGEA